MKIKVFSIEEESLAKLGLALRNDKCRKIIILLSKNQMYVNQIADNLKIGVNIVSDQVKVLRELGLLIITRKPIVRKGNDHNYYKLKTDIFISIIPEENKLKRIFKEGIKLTSILLTAGFLWFQTKPTKHSTDSNFDVGEIFSTPFYEDSTFFPMLVIILALVGQLIFNKLKKKK